jgi:hypothetical protein
MFKIIAKRNNSGYLEQVFNSFKDANHAAKHWTQHGFSVTITPYARLCVPK